MNMRIKIVVLGHFYDLGINIYIYFDQDEVKLLPKESEAILGFSTMPGKFSTNGFDVF